MCQEWNNNNNNNHNNDSNNNDNNDNNNNIDDEPSYIFVFVFNQSDESYLPLWKFQSNLSAHISIF